jgi:hypothetical protein
MCLISSQLQLCTCDVTDVTELKHYWILHRFSADKTEYIMGEPMLPLNIDFETGILNQRNLLKRVNEADVFDKPIEFKKKDRLELHFTCSGEHSGFLTYGFEYTGRKWKECAYDVFDWMNTCNELEHGKIEPALEEK